MLGGLRSHMCTERVTSRPTVRKVRLFRRAEWSMGGSVGAAQEQDCPGLPFVVAWCALPNVRFGV
eukprot:9406648-Pyramimonas_sp.AAC.1